MARKWPGWFSGRVKIYYVQSKGKLVRKIYTGNPSLNAEYGSYYWRDLTDIVNISAPFRYNFLHQTISKWCIFKSKKQNN